LGDPTKSFPACLAPTIGHNPFETHPFCRVRLFYDRMAVKIMTLEEIILDIHAMQEDIQVFERKYGALSETFYESYMNGEEPYDTAWVLDWASWAGAYQILLERREQYQLFITKLRATQPDWESVIALTASRSVTQSNFPELFEEITHLLT
jgi:hypothetical protein